MATSSFRESKSITADSPILPLQVDIQDLYENGSLLPDNVLQVLEEELLRTGRGKYSKDYVADILNRYGFTNPKFHLYAIVVENSELYIRYRGDTWSKKRDLHNARIFIPKDPRGELVSYLAGKGGSSSVKFFLHSKKWCVAKIFPETRHKKIEIETLTKLGLLKFMENIPSRKKGNQIHVFQEYFPHHSVLDMFITENSIYKDKCRVLNIFRNMILQVIKCHKELNLLHCDIKLDNFIINCLTDDVTLIDFGCALPKTNPSRSYWMGTESYQAPELKKAGYVTYSEATEVYALGFSFWQIISPYYVMSNGQSGYDVDFYREIFSYLVSPLLEPNPLLRPSLSNLLAIVNKLIAHYAVESPAREVDIGDYFSVPDVKSEVAEVTALHKKEFIAKLAKSIGVINIRDAKGHTLHQHYEFQRELIKEGLRIGPHVLPVPVKVPVSNRISNAERLAVVDFLKTELHFAKKESRSYPILKKIQDDLGDDAIKTFSELENRLNAYNKLITIPSAVELFKTPVRVMLDSFRLKRSEEVKEESRAKCFPS